MRANRQSGSDHGIYENLRGEVCACGDPKLPGKSFCKRDYFKLPRAMRNALYQRENYVDAFRAALAFLGLACPAEAGRRREEPTAAAAIRVGPPAYARIGSGPRARNPKLFRDA